MPGAFMQLIPQWRLWWRLWSVRLPLIGLAVLAFFLELPDVALSVWLALPADLKSYLPPDFGKYLGYAIILGTPIARVIRQRRLDAAARDQARNNRMGPEGEPDIPQPDRVGG